MANVTRTSKQPGDPSASMVGMEFYEIDQLNVFSFCPDSNDASTPATQVHIHHRIKAAGGSLLPSLVMRCHGPDTLDAYIEALIEHRVFTFGRREFHSDYPEQE